MNQRVCPNSGKELAVDDQVLYTMIAMYVDDWTIQTFQHRRMQYQLGDLTDPSPPCPFTLPS